MIGFIIPFIQGVYLSLCQFMTIKDATFVGLQNFAKALRRQHLHPRVLV